MANTVDNVAPDPASYPRRFLRPGFNSLDVIPVGKYIVKMSVSQDVVMVAHWIGNYMSREGWLESARVTMHIHFFSDVEKMKVYLNGIEHE